MKKGLKKMLIVILVMIVSVHANTAFKSNYSNSKLHIAKMSIGKESLQSIENNVAPDMATELVKMEKQETTKILRPIKWKNNLKTTPIELKCAKNKISCVYTSKKVSSTIIQVESTLTVANQSTIKMGLNVSLKMNIL